MNASKNFYDVVVPNVLNRIDQFLNIINDDIFPKRVNAEKNQTFTDDFDYRKLANQVRMFSSLLSILFSENILCSGNYNKCRTRLSEQCSLRLSFIYP